MQNPPWFSRRAGPWAGCQATTCWLHCTVGPMCAQSRCGMRVASTCDPARARKGTPRRDLSQATKKNCEYFLNGGYLKVRDKADGPHGVGHRLSCRGREDWWTILESKESVVCYTPPGVRNARERFGKMMGRAQTLVWVRPCRACGTLVHIPAGRAPRDVAPTGPDDLARHACHGAPAKRAGSCPLHFLGRGC